MYDGVVPHVVLHGDLARDFVPLGFGVIRLDEDIILAQVLLHGQVFRDACRDASWGDKLQHFLKLFLLRLQLVSNQVCFLAPLQSLSFNQSLDQGRHCCSKAQEVEKILEVLFPSTINLL